MLLDRKIDRLGVQLILKRDSVGIKNPGGKKSIDRQPFENIRDDLFRNHFAAPM
jgi:hypothetical protein